MALTSTTVQYKTRPWTRLDDTRITSPKPLDNDMPSSPVSFITPSGLVTFQHDLKARITSSSLLKVPLTMRPLIKKRSSIPFTLTLKRHSTTIFFSRSSASSSSGSPSYTPASEVVDPISTTDVIVESPLESSVRTTPSIGTKIVDRFWPEEDACYSEENHCSSIPATRDYPAALAPPPHHRRAPHSFGSICEAPFSDQFPSRTRDEHNTGPLRFPF